MFFFHPHLSITLLSPGHPPLHLSMNSLLGFPYLGNVDDIRRTPLSQGFRLHFFQPIQPISATQEALVRDLALPVSFDLDSPNDTGSDCRLGC